MHTIFWVPFGLRDDIVLKWCVEMHLTELCTEPAPLLDKQVKYIRTKLLVSAVRSEALLFWISAVKSILISRFLMCQCQHVVVLPVTRQAPWGLFWWHLSGTGFLSPWLCWSTNVLHLHRDSERFLASEGLQEVCLHTALCQPGLCVLVFNIVRDIFRVRAQI